MESKYSKGLYLSGFGIYEPFVKMYGGVLTLGYFREKEMAVAALEKYRPKRKRVKLKRKRVQLIM